MPTADHWINLRFNNRQGAQATRQANLQAHFLGQLGGVGNPTTMAFLTAMFDRVGKLLWRSCLELSSNSAPATIGQWRKTNAGDGAEEILQMNCWEAVLYIAFQVDALKKSHIKSLYKSKKAHHAAKITRTFGAHKQIGDGTPNAGDILTFYNHGKGEIDHVAVYAGVHNHTEYLIHNLAWCSQVTHIDGQGCIHFESVQHTIDNYTWSKYGDVTCFYTAPFWAPGSPTYGYARSF
jgi:hypothetical protein